ncbi:MAG: hypothetical protein D6781_10280 [Verrucomicrobia bacterium]|nr:MAG: hypothetical protein D6781_10280 [Verrucomicrobiota bacterium]
MHGSSVTHYRKKVPRTGAAREDSDRIRLRPAWLMWGAILTILVSFVSPKMSVLLGGAVAAWGIWYARAEYLPALIVVQFSIANFFIAGGGGIVPPIMVIAGFPFNVGYIIAFAMAARNVYEFLNTDTFRQAGVRWLFILWLIAIPFTMVMSVMGKLEENMSWTGPLRVTLMAGAFFYGLILRKTWPVDGRVIYKGLVPIMVVFYLLADFSLFWHRYLFVFVALGVPAGILATRQRRLLWKVLGWMCVILTVDYGLGLGIVSFIKLGGGLESLEGDATSSGGLGGIAGGSATLTLNFVMLSSAAMTMFYFIRTLPGRRLAGRLLGLPAFGFLVAFSVMIALLSPRYAITNATLGEDAGSASVSEKLMYKLFDERSVIWNATFEDIVNGPKIFRPSGRPVIIPMYNGEDREWVHGAHNVIMEVLVSLRFVAGPIVLCMYAVAMIGCARTFGSEGLMARGVLAIATLATALIGGVTGHYPMTDEVSFLFMGLAGLGWTASTGAAKSEWLVVAQKAAAKRGRDRNSRYHRRRSFFAR